MIIMSSVQNTGVNLDTAAFVPIYTGGVTQISLTAKTSKYIGTGGDYTTLRRPIRLTACIHVTGATAGDVFQLTAHCAQSGQNVVSSAPQNMTVSSTGIASITFEMVVSPMFCLTGLFRIAVSRVSGTGSTDCAVTSLVVDETVTDVDGRVDVGTILGEAPLSENTIAETVNAELVANHGDGVWGNLVVAPEGV